LEFFWYDVIVVENSTIIKCIWLDNKDMKKTATRTHRGGKREGAGRPEGSGKYGQPTKAMRVPCGLINELQEFLVQYRQPAAAANPPLTLKAYLGTTMHRPLYQDKVAAGFPSPADDHIEMQLDLNEHLVKNPASTFYVRVVGDSMLGAGIHPDDLLVVDLGVQAKDGNIVIALLDGEFTVKRLKMSQNKPIQLIPENKNYPIIDVKEGMDFRIWGVVTNVIHSLLR
jgi:DNA polymerase V